MLSLTLTCMLQLLSMVTLLPLKLISIQAYPITSNPIEWTAENWAWQAWARQTSEEQSKGKSRKVTPKSIFDIPYRNGCPPGHHSDGKRCIPTVSIDPSTLLNQQVLAFVGNGDGDIQFEYEDDVGSASATDNLGFQTQFNSYDAPQKFSDDGPTNIDNIDKLPSQDAPLKFNFFEQNSPTNENETMTFDSMPMEEFDLPAKPAESSNLTITTIDKPANQTFLNTTTVTFTNNNTNESHNEISKNVQNATVIQSNQTINNDLLSESSNISANMADKHASVDRTYFLTNIDAISLPAQAPKRPSMHVNKTSHRVSIYKGDSALEVIKTDSSGELEEFLEADDLLPLGNLGEDVASKLRNQQVENTSENDALDYPTFLPLKQEFNEEEFQGENTEDFYKKKIEKTDHIRSVSESSPLSAIELEAQELTFTTTMEPDATTSFQLDDTTVIEEPHPPTYELQELLLTLTTDKVQQQPKQQYKQEQTKSEVNVELLKVKPVKNVFTFNVNNDYVMEEITTTTMAAETTIEIETSTLPPLTKTPQEQHQSEIINEGVHINVDKNRFDYQIDMVANLMDMLPTSTDIDTTTATTISTSERIISALNQDTTTTTRKSISETDSLELNDSKYLNKLNNNELVSTTTILQNSDKESLLNTKADVFVNNNNDENGHADANNAGEIVFMVMNKQRTDSTTANNVMESLAVSSEKETATTTQNSLINNGNKITERTTSSKRWSKVMPIFDINSTTTITTETWPSTNTKAVQLVDETTSKLHLKDSQPISTTISPTLAPITEVVTTKSSSISISEKRKSSNINRRNSKIIRLDKYPIAAVNVNNLSEATKQPIKTTTEVVIDKITTTTTTTETPSNSYIDPFWWLPLDWHLDRHEESNGRPLLLRLWTSVTSNREAKV